MSWERICPEIHYRKSEKGICVTSCFGIDGDIFLPDLIDGEAVTGIAPYAFSQCDLEKDDLIWLSNEGQFLTDKKRLIESEVTTVRLPEGITDIGRYAFYRCRNLRKLVFSDGILQIGGGALNGCRLSELEIYCNNGKKSALKSVLEEVRYEIYVRIFYRKEDGTTEISEVLFPEHYEEAVENTPARILYTSHHGAGGYYRQCFYDRELDYQKYDQLFVRAVTEETEETVIRLAVGRLRFPVALSLQAKETYERYVKDHMEEAMQMYVKNGGKAQLEFLARSPYASKGAFEQAIDCAGALGKAELLSVLMEEKRKKFPGRKKMFEL